MPTTVDRLESRALLTLLGVGTSSPQIAYGQASTVSTSYDASTHDFVIDADALTFRSTAGAPLRISASTVAPLGQTFDIRIQVDNSGNLIGGVAGPDLLVNGKVTINGTPYSGTLLTGEIVDFGYQNVGAEPSGADNYDFRFTPTGGLLVTAGVYSPDTSIGVTTISEFSTFNGSFGQNFKGKSKGTLGLDAGLGDFVWNDLNGNGLQDNNEPGVAGVTVTLTGGGADEIINGIGDTTATTTTNADGSYQFSKLTPGMEYKVTFTGLPSAYVFTTQDAGSGGSDTIDSDVDPANGMTPIVTLAAGEFNSTLDAGIVYRPVTIGDYVWVDTNANGIQDDGATGISGVTLTLNGTDVFGNQVTDTTTTDANGLYSFTNLTPGTYSVQFVQPGGYTGVSPDNVGGNDAIDSDGVLANMLMTATTTLVSGQTDDSLDQGFYQPAAIGNFVWNDLNADGLQDVGEPGIPNVTVNLKNAGGTVIDTTTTDANGLYSFTNLTPGTYSVQFVQPGGYTGVSPDNVGGNDAIDSDGVLANMLMTATTTLVSGQTDDSLDQGFYQPAAIGNFVWNDLNADGLQDIGEPGIPNVTVNLKDAGGTVIDTTTTDANGLYSFTNLTPGTYSVQFVQPGGYTGVSPDNVGGNDAIDSDGVLANMLMTATTTLVSGQTDDSLDQGFYQSAPLIQIEKLVRVNNGTDFDADVPTGPTANPGNTVTFTYLVTNPGQLPLGGVVVTDRNVDPNTNVPIGPAFNPSPVLNGLFNVGDTNTDNLLDPSESWLYTSSYTAVSGGYTLPVSFAEINKYLLIGTTSDAIAQAVNVQNGDLGADVVVLSEEINDNVDFDLDDVFLPKAWVNVDAAPNTQPDYLPGAAQVGESTTWTGDVALTSPTGYFNMSNVELYGQVGVVAARSNPVSSVSNSLYFPNGVGNGVTPGVGVPLPPNGVTGGQTASMAALRAELDELENYVTNLVPEATLSPGSGLPTSQGIEDVPGFIFTTNIDLLDTNNDGIAVIDILVDNGNSDFKITNTNWIIEGDGSTFAIFRIRGGSNMVINQGTILMGDDGIGAGGLGAIFVKANDYRNAANNGYNPGEPLNSSDGVFNFNDVVLNGVGIYDLVVFDEENTDPQFDNGTTEIIVNNGQGCAQFISPKINFNNVRFDRCGVGEIDVQHKNIADVSGTTAGNVTVVDDDPAHWVVGPAAMAGTATKFYVVDPNATVDAAVSNDLTFEYGSTGAALSGNYLAAGNTNPRDIASNPVGDKLWVINNGSTDVVYVYNTSGGSLGSWTARTTGGANLGTPEGIATNGTDIWIVDDGTDTVYRFNNRAATLTGTISADSSFVLNNTPGNTNTSPKGITTDGVSLWVVDNQSLDKVFKYDLNGVLLGSWTISTPGGVNSPTGITIDPANVSNIWIVDNGQDKVYTYTAAATVTSGIISASSSFALVADNGDAQGIANPPPLGSGWQQLPVAESVLALPNVQDASYTGIRTENRFVDRNSRDSAAKVWFNPVFAAKRQAKQLEDHALIIPAAGNDGNRFGNRRSPVSGTPSNRSEIGESLRGLAAFDQVGESASELDLESLEGLELDSLFEALGSGGELQLMLSE